MLHLPHQLSANAAALSAAFLPADLGQKVQRCLQKHPWVLFRVDFVMSACHKGNVCHLNV